MSAGFFDDWAIQLPCGYCGAKPGDWCETKGGRSPRWLHSARTFIPMDTYGAGYQEGFSEARDIYEKRGVTA